MNQELIERFLTENPMKFKEGVGFVEYERWLGVMLGNDEQTQVLEQALMIVQMVEAEINQQNEAEVLLTYAGYLQDREMFPEKISTHVVAFLNELWFYGVKFKSVVEA